MGSSKGVGMTLRENTNTKPGCSQLQGITKNLCKPVLAPVTITTFSSARIVSFNLTAFPTMKSLLSGLIPKEELAKPTKPV
jgi:hypothetical protein